MDCITRHKYFFPILSLLIAIPFIVRLPEVKTVDNVDYFTLENDPDILFYDEFKEIFGNDEFFIIAFKKDDIFTNENLKLLQDITRDLEEIEDIREVKSLANVNETIGEMDYFYVQKFLEDIPQGKDELRKLKIKALSNPLYVKNFISEDGKTSAIVISVYDRPDDPEYRKRVISHCHTVMDEYRNKTGEVFMAGWTTTNLYLSQYMKKDIAIFIPITYIFITLAIFLFFRNILLTLVAVLNISICMGSTMGLFPIFGITLNNVTTIVPPVVMALALCDIVHIFSHISKADLIRFRTKEKALAHTMRKVFLPCFLTTLTTTVGFLSLYISDIPPIKEFALIASCGMVFEFFFSFLFMPPLLLIFDEKRIFHDQTKAAGINTVLERMSDFVADHFKSICLASFVIITSSAVFASFIKVETNLLDYFKKGSEVQLSNTFVEKNLAGISTLDISVIASEENGFKHPENLQIIEKLQNYINHLEGVDKALSFADFLKDMNQSFHNEKPEFLTLPETLEMTSQYLLLYDGDDINDFVNETFDHARISIRLSKHSTREQETIINKINAYIGSIDHEGLTIKVTGKVLQDVNTIDSLVKGQIYSLSVAAAIIIVIMFFVLRSILLGCVSIIPNLFPIILNFGIMGALGIPLNTATALISAVAIGIAVDDTIHFLTELKFYLGQGDDIKKSVRESIRMKGKAILLSSLILCIGFGVMVFSRFVPTIHFGALSSVTMITAVIGDILILPSVAIFLSAAGIRFHKIKETSSGT